MDNKESLSVKQTNQTLPVELIRYNKRIVLYRHKSQYRWGFWRREGEEESTGEKGTNSKILGVGFIERFPLDACLVGDRLCLCVENEEGCEVLIVNIKDEASVKHPSKCADTCLDTGLNSYLHHHSTFLYYVDSSHRILRTDTESFKSSPLEIKPAYFYSISIEQDNLFAIDRSGIIVRFSLTLLKVTKQIKLHANYLNEISSLTGLLLTTSHSNGTTKLVLLDSDLNKLDSSDTPCPVMHITRLLRVSTHVLIVCAGVSPPFFLSLHRLKNNRMSLIHMDTCRMAPSSLHSIGSSLHIYHNHTFTTSLFIS